jgi:myosin heavy subunit
MSFNYDKHKSEGESGIQWTSYSDLFMSLSVIFLLLYVTASLKQGTSTLQQNIEQAKLKQENSDLRQQIKVYNSLKDDYLQEDASQDEQKVYHDLMNRLNLLQDQAKTEKDQLREKAQQNEQKENALNQYQKLIKNIINNNMLSKARIKRRDQIIVKKDDVISQRQTEIRSLERSVEEKKRVISEGQKTIENINSTLDNKMKELNQAYQNQEISKKKLDQEKARLKEESAKRVAALQEQNLAIGQQLSQANTTLETVNSQLENAKGTIEKQGQEKNRLQAELEGSEAKYNGQVAELNKEYEAKRAAEKGRFEAELKKHKLSAAARADREAQFKAQVEGQARDLQAKLAGLNGKIKETEGELVKARAQADARKSIARDIQKNFANNGIKATVDPNNGDVILDFGEQYFDTGKADLKPAMRNIIEKAVPVYSQSLFENERISKKIKSVEIIGFASPTYKGKYIDPQSLNPEDRTAVDFNLALSFSRARSIFKYIFDTNKLTFKHQRQLLPLVKVTGRSFLAEKKSDRETASGMTQKEFCESHDCSKAQRVIIKFNLDE